MIKALIFDFDGLIFDTEVPDYQSWLEIYQSHGCELPFETWATAIGTSGDAFDPYLFLETQYGQAVERETIRLKRRDRFEELIKEAVALPGVEDYLRTAKRLGLKLAVASSSHHAWVDGYLARLGLIEHFDSIRCADDVRQAKPAPELYLVALEALGVRPKEAIAFEDSPNGVKAAKSAGIFCVAVPNQITRLLPLDHADVQLTSLAEMTLEELIASVEVERL